MASDEERLHELGDKIERLAISSEGTSVLVRELLVPSVERLGDKFESFEVNISARLVSLETDRAVAAANHKALVKRTRRKSGLVAGLFSFLAGLATHLFK